MLSEEMDSRCFVVEILSIVHFSILDVKQSLHLDGKTFSLEEIDAVSGTIIIISRTINHRHIHHCLFVDDLRIL